MGPIVGLIYFRKKLTSVVSFFGSGETLLLANAPMNYKKREINIYFMVRLVLDTFWSSFSAMTD